MTSKGKCANCGKEVAQEYLPFCSKRCADVDLARWFRGDYSVPVIEDETQIDDNENDEDNFTNH